MHYLVWNRWSEEKLNPAAHTTELPDKPGHEYFDAAKVTCRCLFCRIRASYAQACFVVLGPSCPATAGSDQTNLYSSTLSARAHVCIRCYFPPKIVPCDELCRLSCLRMPGRFRGGGGGGLLQKKQFLLLSLSSSPTLAYKLLGLLWRLYESSSSSSSYSVSSLLPFRSSFFSASTSTSCWHLDPISYWSLEFCLAFNIKESIISFENCHLETFLVSMIPTEATQWLIKLLWTDTAGKLSDSYYQWRAF